MEKKTITKVVDNGQCVSCALCKAVCPQKCIDLNMVNRTTYLPQIDEEKCCNCGICNNICPGNPFDYNRQYSFSSEPDNFYVGNYSRIISMQTQNPNILKNATSGGVVTQLIKILLDRDEYDCAFLVNTHNYSQPVHSKRILKSDDILKTSKSRYVPIAQDEAISYALRNRNEKIIFVGTSCFVHGLVNVVKYFSLDRKNYLILGLFCDRTMNYGIYDYFSQHPKCTGKLEQMLFRTKEAGGWPGNMRLIFHDGTFINLNAKERMMVKDYFQLEGCLYCLDKLNQFADISIGDDYTSSKKDKSGRSAVLIRTEKGEQIIESTSDYFNSFAIKEKDLETSQKVYLRCSNIKYSKLKDMAVKIPESVVEEASDFNADFANEYKERIRKIKMGSVCSYKQIRVDIPVKKKIICLAKSLKQFLLTHLETKSL